jgi:hypothetical protein
VPFDPWIRDPGWVNRRVADPDPGSGIRCLLTPGSGIQDGKKSGSRSGMNNPDHISESFETIFWGNILKFFDADEIRDGKNLVPGSGMENNWIRDPGRTFPDRQHWSTIS